MKRHLAIPVLILSLAFHAFGSVRIANKQGQSPSWPTMPIPFWINATGSPQIPNGSEFSAIRAAFQAWQNIAIAKISFKDMGTTPVSTVGQDGLNVVTFVDNSIPLGSDTIAATFSFFGLDASGNLTVQESDIALNPTANFSTSGDPDKYDIQGVVTHEIGHLLGLDHSSMLSAVMTARGAPGQLDQRALSYDDMAGVAAIYPNPTATAALGSISGSILSAGIGKFGAQVVALDANGTALASALSQQDGTFVIPFLPAGAYRLYAEPLDGPSTELDIGGNPSSLYYKLDTDFSTTYYGDVASLSAAQTTNVVAGSQGNAIGIQVRAASALNLTAPRGFAPHVPLSGASSLTVGGVGISPGDTFAVSSADVTLGTPLYGGSIAADAPTSAQLAVNVLATAVPGPKSVIVTQGIATSILSGGLVVTNPRPSAIQAVPSSGPTSGGTLVLITGQNFQSGAQVYFGGLAASSLQFIDASTIRVTSPPNSGGAANVVVVNPDNTWGVQLGGFTSVAGPPLITSALPLSGPATTLVHIAGSDFDTRAENLDVRFNGISATIISASRSAIDAIVPYGDATGTITVAVTGQVAIGPLFTLTPTALSVNVPLSGDAFLDASVSGGGTSVTLNDPDDSSALVDLPFTFTFFDKTYLAGSKIAVSTNGIASLDAVTSPAYQNFALPAQLEPALIAPFFDDLFVRSGGGVSVRTVGVTPNRRFVIEWSNMGILDEQGNDVGAALTFEAVLFEGSNDVRLVYKTLTGSRSDGSSATVGIQDSKMTKAILSGFNQGILSSGLSIAYQFSGGNYSLLNHDRPFSISDRGSFSATTSGVSSNLTVGYATIQPASGQTTPSGIAIFGFRTNGVLVSEAGVPAAALLRGARVYAEVDGGVNTGLAIANPGTQDATVSFYFTDNNGVDSGNGSTVIPANSQIARFLDQPPFNGHSGFHGTFTLSSTQPVAVVALRGLTNERSEFLITTLPVLDTATAAVSKTTVLPHFADGGGWTTQIALVNSGDTTMSGNVQFVSSTGTTLNTIPFSIPRRTSTRVVTAGTGASIQSGSVRIIPNSGSNSPVSLAIFSFKSGGVTVSEAGVPAISGTAFRAYVEAIGSVQSGLAMANSTGAPIQINFDLRDLAGNSIATASQTIPANGQLARFLNEIFTTLPASVQGVLRITPAAPGISVVGLRGRYNERGDFLITTTPATDETAVPGTAPQYFPHFATGGGYTTQFVLFSGSTGQSSSGYLIFTNQDGTPLSPDFQ